jgi:arylsulfatase A-like enzyme/tetratricopeptide (TPR) repeat protein
VWALAAAFGLAIGATGCGRFRAQPGPIVLISIDTLRADHLPVYGYTKVRTPAIDALAADSTVFENAWSHSPQTLPSHTSILSGELPFEHGVRDNGGFTVKPGQWLIQRTLHDAGWKTGGFVSAYVLRRETGIAQGFDTYDSDMPAASPEASIGMIQRDGADTLDAATRWLNAQADAKFFLFVHFYEPHKPYSPPARYAMYAPYDGDIAYADELVGRLLDRLRARGLYDRATIVLLSDHGEGLGDHGEQEHGLFLYRETTHVPLMIKGPGDSPHRVPTPVQHIDVVPTLLEIAKLPRPANLRGRSLTPLLNGSGSIPENGIYSEALYSRFHFGWSELYALTDSRYRLIRAPRDELFDLHTDAAESKSVAAEHPQVRQAMRSAIDTMISGVSIAPPSAVTEEDRQRLAALGYVGTGSRAPLTQPGDSLPDPKDKFQVLETYRRAVDLATAGHFDEAASLYEGLVADDPGMDDVWLELAHAYARQGRTADAVRAYKQIVAHNPKDASGVLGAARGLLELGELDEARAHAELAVPLAPAGAHELLARIAVRQRDRDTALREADATEAAGGLPMRAFVEGLLAYDAGRYDEAVSRLLDAHSAIEGHAFRMADLNFYLGDSFARMGHYPEAERYFLEEIRLFPYNTGARMGLATLYRAMGRDADSDRVIDDLVRLSPTPATRALAARLHAVLGGR